MNTHPNHVRIGEKAASFLRQEKKLLIDGKWVPAQSGKVVKIERFGAFVDIGAERPGLVHISELATYRVEEVTEIVKQGQDVEVKVLAVDPRKRQIKLSIKALDVFEPEPEEQDEAPLTAMQIAMQRAMSQQNPRAAANARRERDRERDRAAQEDILSRTLASKRK